MSDIVTTPQSQVVQQQSQNVVDSSDIILPSILSLNGSSNFVATGDGKAGDVFDTRNRKAIASKGECIEIVPLRLVTYWERHQQKPGSSEFALVNTVAVCVNAQKNKATHEQLENDVVTRYKKVWKLFCLLAKDFDIPYCIKFKGLSTNAGKEMATHFALCSRPGKEKPVYFKVYKVWSAVKPWEGKTYNILEICPSRDATIEERQEASRWLDDLNGKKVSTDDENDNSEGNAQGSQTPEVPF